MTTQRCPLPKLNSFTALIAPASALPLEPPANQDHMISFKSHMTIISSPLPQSSPSSLMSFLA